MPHSSSLPPLGGAPAPQFHIQPPGDSRPNSPELEKVEFAGNKYTHLLHLVHSGKKENVCEAVRELAEAGLKHGVRIHSEPSVELIRREMARNPYIDSSKLTQSAVTRIFKESRRKQSARGVQKVAPLLGARCGYERLGQVQNLRGAKFTRATPARFVDLKAKSDEEIFNGAIALRTEAILAGGDQIIHFNTVEFGGAAPNIKVESKGPLGRIYDAPKKIETIRLILASHQIPSHSPQSIAALSPAQFVEVIGRDISKIPNLTEEQQEKLIERVTNKIVQTLVGEVEVGDQLLLQIDSSTPLYGRSYFLHGDEAGVLDALHAGIDKSNPRVADQLAMSLDGFVKQGGADCRGTNSLYALLLNAAYRAAGIKKEARPFYGFVRLGYTTGDFNQDVGGDHNMVLVKKEGKPCEVLDAYNQIYDEANLRDLVNGRIHRGCLGEITGALPYPPEQSWS